MTVGERRVIKRKRTPKPVLGAQAWPTNGHLIKDVARLHINRGDLVADVTPGRGIWWQRFTPYYLHCFEDFTDIDAPDGCFNVVAFDPPYVVMGGKPGTFDHEYEVYRRFDTDPHAGFNGGSARQLQDLIDAGINECARVLAPGGRLLLKTMDYNSSAGYWPSCFHCQATAFSAGLRMIDRFEMIATHPRPQPRNRTQRSARRNHSTLLVFRKPKR